MLDHIFLFSGASAVGKTSVLRSLIPLLQHKGAGPCVCKIDCLQSEDASVFAEMNLRHRTQRRYLPRSFSGIQFAGIVGLGQ